MIIDCGANEKGRVTGTGVTQDIFTYASGDRIRHSFPVILVPGMSQHLLSSTRIGAQARTETVFDPHGTSYLRKRGLRLVLRPAGESREKMFLDIAIDKQPSTEIDNGSSLHIVAFHSRAFGTFVNYAWILERLKASNVRRKARRQLRVEQLLVRPRVEGHVSLARLVASQSE